MGRRARSLPERDRSCEARDPRTLIRDGGCDSGVRPAHSEAMTEMVAGSDRLLKK